MKRFKYQKEIERLDCKLSGFSEIIYEEVFHWVFKDCDESSFYPVAVNNPNRRNNCNGWALSFFDTQKNAKQRLLEIAKHSKNIFKKLGTHIASGPINKDDGVSNEPNKNGHFDLFEYKEVNLSSKFKIVEVVYNEKN
jgi:hypothetical protein